MEESRTFWVVRFPLHKCFVPCISTQKIMQNPTTSTLIHQASCSSSDTRHFIILFHVLMMLLSNFNQQRFGQKTTRQCNKSFCAPYHSKSCNCRPHSINQRYAIHAHTTCMLYLFENVVKRSDKVNINFAQNLTSSGKSLLSIEY